LDEEDEAGPEMPSGLDAWVDRSLCFDPPPIEWPDEAWQPLVDLCNELPALRDVVYASWNQFPRLLLAALHGNHPQSRLYMNWFRLGSLIRSEPAQHDVHPDDMPLATSPCLCSIVMLTSTYEHMHAVNYNEEGLMDLVKGLAPRLKTCGRPFSTIRLGS